MTRSPSELFWTVKKLKRVQHFDLLACANFNLLEFFTSHTNNQLGFAGLQKFLIRAGRRRSRKRRRRRRKRRKRSRKRKRRSRKRRRRSSQR